MNSNLQLISFLVSFIYGIIFCLLTNLNFKLIKDFKLYIQNILTFVYVIDMVIIYIIIFYYLNKGYFHIYFILMVFVGYFVGFLVRKKFISKINVKRFLKNWKKYLHMLVSKWNRMGRRWLELAKRNVKDYF